MSVAAMPLILAKYASASGAFEYASPAKTRTILDKFTARNNTGSGVSLSIYLVPAGGSADASNLLSGATIAANTTVPFDDIALQVLGAGEKLYIEAGSGSAVAIRASGRQITEES